jgi:hypothetical protein
MIIASTDYTPTEMKFLLRHCVDGSGVAVAGAPISRGAAPSDVGTSASRSRSWSSATWPSSTAALVVGEQDTGQVHQYPDGIRTTGRLVLCLVVRRQAEEGQEVRAVADGITLAKHLAGADIERGVQVRGAVPDVVVGAFLAGVEGDRQRLGPVQRLDLRFSSTDNTAAPPGGSRYKSTMSTTFSANSGSLLITMVVAATYSPGAASTSKSRTSPCSRSSYGNHCCRASPTCPTPVMASAQTETAVA